MSGGVAKGLFGETTCIDDFHVMRGTSFLSAESTYTTVIFRVCV
jgi:hypothetical protein